VRKLHDQLPPESKDKLRTVTFGAIQTIFFEFAQPKVALVDGYQVRMHFYALDAASPAAAQDWEVAEARALAGVDALVLAGRCDSKGQCDGSRMERRVRAFLEKSRHDWAKVPLVYEVHSKEGGAAYPLNAVKTALGGARRRTVAESGSGWEPIGQEVLA